ncbi:MAG TPA: hypothetical protein VFS43_21930 [Polyangiaceae bacterium]|nr:hypothetical protein [Polyangiaceae bacterium]
MDAHAAAAQAAAHRGAGHDGDAALGAHVGDDLAGDHDLGGGERLAPHRAALGDRERAAQLDLALERAENAQVALAADAAAHRRRRADNGLTRVARRHLLGRLGAGAGTRPPGVGRP